MLRARLFPTRIASATELAAALHAAGFKDVEIHADPVPLTSWQGKPTGREAHVVVRRSSIGVTADDVGFVRNERGAFDAILSEIHLYRFTKRFFAELEGRCPTLVDGPASDAHVLPGAVANFDWRSAIPEARASTPEGLARDARASSNASPGAGIKGRESSRESAPTAPAPVPDTTAGLFLDPKMRHGIEAVVDAAKARGRAKPWGCLIALVVPILLALPALSKGENEAFVGGIACIVFGWIVGMIVWGIARASATARAGKAEFDRQFPHSSGLRSAAIERLRERAASITDAQKRKVIEQIAKLAHEPPPALKRRIVESQRRANER